MPLTKFWIFYFDIYKITCYHTHDKGICSTIMLSHKDILICN